MADTILIIDFGSQVTQLIARRLRETGVYTEILPCTTDPEKIAAAVPSGIILSGGPTRQNNATRNRRRDLFRIGGTGQNFGINAGFTQTAGDQLGHLRPKINNQNCISHTAPHSFFNITRDSDYRNLACNTAIKNPSVPSRPGNSCKWPGACGGHAPPPAAPTVSAQISPILAASRSGASRKNRSI